MSDDQVSTERTPPDECTCQPGAKQTPKMTPVLPNVDCPKHGWAATVRNDAIAERVDLAEQLYSDVPETDDSIKWVKRKVNTRTIRSTQEYKAGRALYRAQCAVHRNPDGTAGAPCVICSEPIDYNLLYPHPKSWSLEHPVSVQDHPELLMDRNNWASAHWDCNSMKGPDELVPDTGEPSEDWS